MLTKGVPMKLIIDQELAQQTLNAIAKCPYQDVFQLVPKLLQLQVLVEATPVTESAPEVNEVQAAAEAASTQAAQEIVNS